MGWLGLVFYRLYSIDHCWEPFCYHIRQLIFISRLSICKLRWATLLWIIAIAKCIHLQCGKTVTILRIANRPQRSQLGDNPFSFIATKDKQMNRWMACQSSSVNTLRPPQPLKYSGVPAPRPPCHWRTVRQRNKRLPLLNEIRSASHPHDRRDIQAADMTTGCNNLGPDISTTILSTIDSCDIKKCQPSCLMAYIIDHLLMDLTRHSVGKWLQCLDCRWTLLRVTTAWGQVKINVVVQWMAIERQTSCY